MDQDTLTFTPRPIAKPAVSRHEFWPHTGWFRTAPHKFARLYCCSDRGIMRRAVVTCQRGRWGFEVREFVSGATQGLLIAQQPMILASRNIAACWSAADRAACARG